MIFLKESVVILLMLGIVHQSRAGVDVETSLRGTPAEGVAFTYNGIATQFSCNSAFVIPKETLVGALNYSPLPESVRACEAISVWSRGTISAGQEGCSIPADEAVMFVVHGDGGVRLKVSDNLLVEDFKDKEETSTRIAVTDQVLPKNVPLNYFFEYTRQPASGKVPAGFFVEWTTLGGRSGQVEKSCLSMDLRPGEKERMELQERLPKGWGTFDAKNMFSHVRLPEGLSLHGGIYKKAGGLSLEGASVGGLYTDTQIRPGLHAYDQSYTEVERVNWQGKGFKVESAIDDDNELVMQVTQYHDTLDGGDYVWYYRPEMLFGRAGKISATGSPGDFKATFPGMDYTVSLFSTAAAVQDASWKIQGPYFAVTLVEKSPVVGFSVNKKKSLAHISEVIARKREALVKSLKKYNDRDLDDANRAMHGVLAWNTIYTPIEHGLVTPVSRMWDFGAGYVLFEWDNFFGAMMTATHNVDIAYVNLIQMFKAITQDGCVPNYISGTNISADRTEPPVGTAIALKLYKEFGDKWVLDLLFDDFVAWNDWFWRRRLEQPVGLITLGSDDIGPANKNSFSDARLESGLDNSPMYEDGSIEWDPETHHMRMYDVGFSALFVHESKALLEIIDIVGGPSSLVSTINDRISHISKATQDHLWNSKAGIYMNKRSNDNTFIERLSPTMFYPLLAGIPTDEQATTMITQYLTSPDHFCVDDAKCMFAAPSISRADEAYADDDYWRGRTWGPHNYLVWASLQQYSHLDIVHKAAQTLTRQSLALLLGEFRLFGHVHENYNTEEGVGCNHGGSDPFYHWGALNGYIAIQQAIKDGKVTA